jgi:hypothetical protein
LVQMMEKEKRCDKESSLYTQYRSPSSRERESRCVFILIVYSCCFFVEAQLSERDGPVYMLYV